MEKSTIDFLPILDNPEFQRRMLGKTDTKKYQELGLFVLSVQ